MKHVPVRSCIVCRKQADKSGLVRIVKTDGGFEVDLSGKAAGRGAYVCKSAECFDNLVKKCALSKAFKTQVSKAEHQKIGDALRSIDFGE